MGLWQCLWQSPAFFHMKWPFWGIKNPSGSPGGDGAPAPAKALWGEAPAAVLSWDQWIPWVFTGQNGQKGMMEWSSGVVPGKIRSEKKCCIASCDLKQETLAFRTFLRTNSQKFLKYPIPNIWYWSQRLILPSGTKSLKAPTSLQSLGESLPYPQLRSQTGATCGSSSKACTCKWLIWHCVRTHILYKCDQMWLLNVIEYSSYVHYIILYIAVCVYIYVYTCGHVCIWIYPTKMKRLWPTRARVKVSKVGKDEKTIYNGNTKLGIQNSETSATSYPSQSNFAMENHTYIQRSIHPFQIRIFERSGKVYTTEWPNIQHALAWW